MRPPAARQRELCAHAIVELLWKVKPRTSDLCKLELYIVQLGEKKYAVFAIKGPTLNFEIPSHFEQDGVTERVYCVLYIGNIIFIRKFQLHVYRCKTKRELRAVIRRHFPRVCS